MFCKDCVGKITTMMANGCSCGNEKNSVYKYCKECSTKLGVCELCGKKLNGIEEVKMSEVCDSTFGDMYHCPDCKENVIVHTCSKHPIKPEDLKCPRCGKDMVPGMVS